VVTGCDATAAEAALPRDNYRRQEGGNRCPV